MYLPRIVNKMTIEQSIHFCKMEIRLWFKKSILSSARLMKRTEIYRGSNSYSILLTDDKILNVHHNTYNKREYFEYSIRENK